MENYTILDFKEDPTAGRHRVTVRYNTKIFNGVVSWEYNPIYGEVARYGEYLNEDTQATGRIKDAMGDAYNQYGELVGPPDKLWPCCITRPNFEQWLRE